MGDKKPKKNSSGNADAYKAKKDKHQSERPPAAPKESLDKKKK
jgi:hypothetical protein